MYTQRTSKMFKAVGTNEDVLDFSVCEKIELRSTVFIDEKYVRVDICYHYQFQQR